MSAKSSDSHHTHPFSKYVLGRETLLAPLGLLLIALVCVLFWFASSGSPIGVESDEKAEHVALCSPILTTPLSDTISSFYSVQVSDNNLNDVFLITLPLTSTVLITNITQSSELSESWPIPSHSGDMLAYYATDNRGKVTLFISYLDGKVKTTDTYSANSGLGTDYQVDLTQPPVWSPHDEWVAFLGQRTKGKDGVSELFVMPTKSTDDVKRLTDHGHRVMSPLWLDDTNLVYVETRSNVRATLYQISVLQAEPMRVEIPEFTVSQQ